MSIVNMIAELPVLGVVVFALTAWLKQMGLRGRWLTGSAFGLGLILGVGYRYAVQPPASFAEWFGAAVFGLLAGAMATGAYKGVESATGKTYFDEPLDD